MYAPDEIEARLTRAKVLLREVRYHLRAAKALLAAYNRTADPYLCPSAVFAQANVKGAFRLVQRLIRQNDVRRREG